MLAALHTQVEQTDVVPLRRCCRRHHDWQQLAEHLLADFPEVQQADVLLHLRNAIEAVAFFELDGDDQVETAELICRHQLSLLSGRIGDIARLDPQSHPRRCRPQRVDDEAQRSQAS